MEHYIAMIVISVFVYQLLKWRLTSIAKKNWEAVDVISTGAMLGQARISKKMGLSREETLELLTGNYLTAYKINSVIVTDGTLGITDIAGNPYLKRVIESVVDEVFPLKDPE